MLSASNLTDSAVVWERKCEKYQCPELPRGTVLGSSATAIESSVRVSAIKASLMDN